MHSFASYKAKTVKNQKFSCFSALKSLVQAWNIRIIILSFGIPKFPTCAYFFASVAHFRAIYERALVSIVPCNGQFYLKPGKLISNRRLRFPRQFPRSTDSVLYIYLRISIVLGNSNPVYRNLDFPLHLNHFYLNVYVGSEIKLKNGKAMTLDNLYWYIKLENFIT